VGGKQRGTAKKLCWCSLPLNNFKWVARRLHKRARSDNLMWEEEAHFSL